jgi:hypothetical protein
VTKSSTGSAIRVRCGPLLHRYAGRRWCPAPFVLAVSIVSPREDDQAAALEVADGLVLTATSQLVLGCHESTMGSPGSAGQA